MQPNPKLAAALKWLGPRWVFSADRRRELDARIRARRTAGELTLWLAQRHAGYPR